MVSKLATLLLMVGSLWGQQGNTIFASLAANSSAGGSFSVPPQYMIGQSGHQAFMTLSNATAHTCTPSTTVYGQVQIQGSYDKVNWTNITPLSQTDLNGVANITGQGVFPFTQLTTTISDATNCRYSLYYGGVVSSTTAAPNVVTSHTYGNVNGSTPYNNSNLVSEKGQRFVYGTGTGTTSAGIAIINIGSTISTTAQVVLDCVMVTGVVKATIVTGASAEVFMSGSAITGSAPLFSVGVPTGAAVGTTFSRDMCGLNMYLGTGASGNLVIAGITNVGLEATISYFLVGI
jgi:hypothetical protein